MRVQHRLQLGAAVVIANAAVALQSLSSPASAATCSAPGEVFLCDEVFYCDANDPDTPCAMAAPAGCTVTYAVCLYGTVCNAWFRPFIYCYYQ